MSTGALLELLWGAIAGSSAPYTHMKPPLNGNVVAPVLGGMVNEVSYGLQPPPPGLDNPIPPTPPPPDVVQGWRMNRGPILPSSFIEVSQVTGNSLDSNSNNIIKAGTGGIDMSHKGLVFQVNTYGVALTVDNGFSPTPLLDQSSNPVLSPVALVTAKGNMINPTIASNTSTKARVLQQIGANIPFDYVRAGSTDDPATIFAPNFSIADPVTAAVYEGMLWDLNRLRPADFTWDNFGPPRAAFTAAAASITSGNATINVPGGAFTANDVGLLVTGTGIPAGAYIRTFVTSTQVILTSAPTVTNPAVNLTFTPVRPSTMGFAWECQNMSRTLDLANNPGYPIDRYPNATSLSQLAVAESVVWGTTATKLPLGPLMLLKEDVDNFVDADPTTWPKHALGVSVPIQPGTHVWPAQQHDTTIHFDTAALVQEGYRLRMPLSVDPPAGAHILHKIIHRIAQTYGLVVWDSAGNITFRCDRALRAYITGTQTVSNVLNGFQWGSMQVLAIGSKVSPNP